MRILITGSNGFIGKKLVHEFKNSGHQIAVVIRSEDSRFTFDTDIRILNSYSEKIEQEIIIFSPEVVFHTAGLSLYPKSKHDEELLWDANLYFGINLLKVLQKCDILLFINFNTSLAYDGLSFKPSSFYALTKFCFFNSLLYFSHNSNYKVFNLILYSVYGPNDSNKRVINYVIDSINSSEEINMSPGLQKLDFIHVDDVVLLCVKLLNEVPINKVEDIHVGTGKGTNLVELKDLVQKKTSQSCKINFGGIPYREDEKMINIAPSSFHRFWKSTIDLEEGIKTLLS